jgi:phage baseplate assembly protein W
LTSPWKATTNTEGYIIKTYIDYPFHIDGRGSTAETYLEDHVRDMIYQVLFTSPGERANLPDFGCGLLQLVFMPNSDILATTTQFLVHGALQRWLGDLIQVEQVRVTSEEEQILVDVAYVLRESGQRQQGQFISPMGRQ